MLTDISKKLGLTQKLLKQLESSDIKKRLRAVKLLRMIGDKEALEPLYKLLSYRNMSVFAETVHAIGKIGDAGAVAPLLTCLEQTKEERKLLVIRALGSLGDKGCIPYIKRNIAHFNPKIRVAAAQALIRLGETSWEGLIDGTDGDFENCVSSGDADVVAGLLKMSHAHSKKNSRPSALMKAIQKHGQKAEGAFIKALKDEEYTIRKEAAYVLGVLRKRSTLANIDKTAEALSAAVDDENDAVSLEALQALAWFDVSYLVKSTMLYGLTGSDQHRFTAIRYFEQHPDAEVALSFDTRYEIIGRDSKGYVLPIIREATGEEATNRLIDRGLGSSNEYFVRKMLEQIKYDKKFDSGTYRKLKKLIFSESEKLRLYTSGLVMEIALGGDCPEAAKELPRIVRQYGENGWKVPRNYILGLVNIGLSYDELFEVVEAFDNGEDRIPEELLFALLKSGHADSGTAVLRFLKRKKYSDSTRIECWRLIGGEQGLGLLLDYCKHNRFGYGTNLAKAFEKIGDERGLLPLYHRFLKALPLDGITIYGSIRRILQKNPGTKVLSQEQIAEMERLERQRCSALAEGEKEYSAMLNRD